MSQLNDRRKVQVIDKPVQMLKGQLLKLKLKSKFIDVRLIMQTDSDCIVSTVDKKGRIDLDTVLTTPIKNVYLPIQELVKYV